MSTSCGLVTLRTIWTVHFEAPLPSSHHPQIPFSLHHRLSLPFRQYVPRKWRRRRSKNHVTQFGNIHDQCRRTQARCDTQITCNSSFHTTSSSFKTSSCSPHPLPHQRDQPRTTNDSRTSPGVVQETISKERLVSDSAHSVEKRLPLLPPGRWFITIVISQPK